uniref:Uncharacterized protein n=1 Tax=Ipomoea trifida TaxID=35884 RepID=Q6JJ48_IPOTF|nr:hypothetical protein [Ipomoea trifida]
MACLVGWKINSMENGFQKVEENERLCCLVGWKMISMEFDFPKKKENKFLSRVRYFVFQGRWEERHIGLYIHNSLPFKIQPNNGIHILSNSFFTNQTVEFVFLVIYFPCNLNSISFKYFPANQTGCYTKIVIDSGQVRNWRFMFELMHKESTVVFTETRTPRTHSLSCGSVNRVPLDHKVFELPFIMSIYDTFSNPYFNDCCKLEAFQPLRSYSPLSSYKAKRS